MTASGVTIGRRGADAAAEADRDVGCKLLRHGIIPFQIDENGNHQRLPVRRIIVFGVHLAIGILKADSQTDESILRDPRTVNGRDERTRLVGFLGIAAILPRKFAAGGESHVEFALIPDIDGMRAGLVGLFSIYARYGSFLRKRDDRNGTKGRKKQNQYFFHGIKILLMN